MCPCFVYGLVTASLGIIMSHFRFPVTSDICNRFCSLATGNRNPETLVSLWLVDRGWAKHQSNKHRITNKTLFMDCTLSFLNVSVQAGKLSVISVFKHIWHDIWFYVEIHWDLIYCREHTFKLILTFGIDIETLDVLAQKDLISDYYIVKRELCLTNIFARRAPISLEVLKCLQLYRLLLIIYPRQWLYKSERACFLNKHQNDNRNYGTIQWRCIR